MNILFVADVSIARVGSGIERVLYEQATRLAAAGHAVHLLTRLDPEIHEQDKETLSGVTEWRYRANRKHPVRFVTDTLKNGGRLFQSLHRDVGFDCLFFHQPLSACAVLFSGTDAHIKKIYTCHSLWPEEYLSRTPLPAGIFKKQFFRIQALARKWMEKRALNGSDRIIALSAYTMEKLRTSHGVPEEKISVIPGGVDLERFRPADDKAVIRRRLDLPAGGVILFTLRNLEPRMGLAALLRAMEKVLQQLPDVHLVIGGDGPLKSSLIEQAERDGLSLRVSFTGFIDEAVLPDYYRMADLFILPTTELEGFGLVTLEAMASGTPVLGTPVGGTQEILEAFDRGFLFDDTSAEAMTRLIREKIGCLIKDPVAFEALRLKTRAFVERRSSWDSNINSMMVVAAATGE